MSAVHLNDERATAPHGDGRARFAHDLRDALPRLRPVLLKTGALALAGGMVAFVVSGQFPQKVRVETAFRTSGLERHTVEKAAAALRSKPILDNIVHALNLGKRGEFAMAQPTAMSVVSELVSGNPMTVTAAEAGVRDRLSKAIETRFDPDQGSFTVSVTALAGEDASRIATMAGDIFRSEITSSTQAADPLIERLRQTFERAEAAFAGFKAQIGPQEASRLGEIQGRQRKLATDLTEAESRLADLKRKSETAGKMTLDDVLYKPLPDSLEFTGLEYSRRRYVEAKLLVDQLSGNLGPLHPRLIAANGMLGDARKSIQTSISQLARSLTEEQASASKRLAELKEAQMKVSQEEKTASALKRFSELGQAAAEAERNYLEARRNSGLTGRVAAAEADRLVPVSSATKLVGFSRAEIATLGVFGGAAFGALLAFFTRRRDEDAVADDELTSMAWDEIDLLAGDSVVTPQDHDETASHGAEHDERHVAEQELPEDRIAFPLPANDEPAYHAYEDEELHAVLMRNRRPATSAHMPSLLSLAAQGQLAAAPVYRQQEVRELRRNIAELRERLQEYAERRTAGSR